ncbi:UDP-N-acetylmuramate--L-alanine ligase [soil metagenome]
MTRSNADIGRGLLPARDGSPIRRGERIHVLGAAGAGASAAAMLARRAGAEVTGCDAGGATPYSAALEASGIQLDWQHAPEHVTNPSSGPVERLAVTKALTAVQPDHPELRAASELQIPVESWQQVIADVAATTGQRLVAIAGTHGKSTTSGWLVHLLVTAGRDPSAFVGALLTPELATDVPATSRWGWGDVIVVEADEYAGNFDAYLPSVVLLLNAEWDHPDVFADEEAVLSAFANWLRRATAGGRRPVLVANVGDAGVAKLMRRMDGWPGDVVTTALVDDHEPGAVISGRLDHDADGRSVLYLERPDQPSAAFQVGLPGRHNAANALAICGAAQVLGVDDEALRHSLASFAGVGRRLELKGEVDGVTVLDDYGHHPTAIARTLEAVRQQYPGRRLWAVYEPLTYHRTALMLDQFADALAGADAVAIADIWPGRDPDTTLTSSAALADAVARRGLVAAAAPGSVEATADHLAARVAAGEVVLVMGGGRSYVIAERLLELLRQRDRRPAQG